MTEDPRSDTQKWVDIHLDKMSIEDLKLLAATRASMSSEEVQKRVKVLAAIKADHNKHCMNLPRHMRFVPPSNMMLSKRARALTS